MPNENTELRPQLQKWSDEAARIASDWNGKDDKFMSGGEVFVEEQVHIAAETLEIISKLEANLKELNIL